MMADLIDRQAAIDAIGEVHPLDYNARSTKARIEQLPTIEIVRCRECKRWNTVLDRNKAEYGLCQNRSQLEATKADFYCADGERRSENERPN